VKETWYRTSKISKNRRKHRAGKRAYLQPGRQTARPQKPARNPTVTGISRSSIQRIVKKDLKLNQHKSIAGQQLKKKRLQRSQQFLHRFPTERSVCSLWFTDEKTFTIGTPYNSQNDRVYAQPTRKRDVSPVKLIRYRQHFSRKVMVFVGMSRMGILTSSLSSQGRRLTANITVNMFSVAVYYQTSVQDASVTHGPCSRTAHPHTLHGTH